MNPLYLTLGFAVIAYSGTTAARVVLSLFALELGADASQVGFLMATFYVFPLLLSWPIGVLADRIGSRKLLLFGFAVGTAGLLIPYFFPNIRALYAAGLLGGMAFVFSNVLVQNLIGLLSEPHERARNFSNASLAGSASNIAGPLIAGLAIDHAGHGIASASAAALFAVAWVMVAVWGASLPGGSGKPAEASKGSLKERLSDKAVLGVILMTCLIQVGQDLYMFYMPVYGHGIGLSATAIGSILAAFAAAACVVRVVLPQIITRYGEERVLAAAFFSATFGFMLLPFFQNAIVLGAISFAFGLGQGCGMPITMMMLFSKSPPGRSGETVGLRQTMNNLGRIITPPIFGLIASATGLMAVFLISGVLMGVGGWMAKPRTGRAEI